MSPLVEELNKIKDVQAYFVETVELPDQFRKGGFKDFSDNDYLIRAWRDKDQWDRALDLAKSADIMIVSPSCPKVFERERLNKGLLTFELSERPLKRGFPNFFSRANLRNQYLYHFEFKNKPLYMLCLSGFTAYDESIMHSFKDRCFRFAYLPRIEDQDVDRILSQKKNEKKIKFIWCARFIKWKHPELVVLLAEKLVHDGYDFEINMIGSGVLHEKIKKMIVSKNLQNYVHLLGNHPNAEVLKIMQNHHIFIFTSDRREGWGVVLNEAMGQVCCPITSNKLGAAPYLMKHKVNGLVFESGNIDSLYQNAKFLMDNPDFICQYASKAYETVHDIWNPTFVANRLYKLCKSISEGNSSLFESGPCSLASPDDSKLLEH
jgi:glycosyltransferase involved in cell wall biosynthesis